MTATVLHAQGIRRMCNRMDRLIDAFNAVFNAVDPVGILLSFVHCEDLLCFSVDRLVSDTKHLTVFL